MSGPIGNPTFSAPVFRTTAGPDEIAALKSAAPASGTASVPAAHGSGQATRPSSTGPLAFMREKFQQFMGAVNDLGTTIQSKIDHVRYAVGTVADKVSAFISGTEAVYQPSVGVAKYNVDSRESPSIVYSAILKHANEVTNLGTFLRSKEGHSEHFNAANFDASIAFAKSIAQTLGSDSKVAFAAKHYDPSTTAYRQYGRAEIGSWNTKSVEQATIVTVVNAFSMLFGHDAVSSKLAASNFTQETKDLYAMGKRAIADSSLPAEGKAEAVKRFQADIILRTIGPAVSSYGAPSKNESTSMVEVAKAIQSFVNLGTFQSGKEPVNANVLKALTAEVPNFRTNINAMFAEMDAQGRVNESEVEKGQIKAQPALFGLIEVPQVKADPLAIEAARLGKISV